MLQKHLKVFSELKEEEEELESFFVSFQLGDRDTYLETDLMILLCELNLPCDLH